MSIAIIVQGLQEQFLYMIQSEIRISTKSSFHQRRFNDLTQFLTSQMGLDADLAHVLLRLHEPNTLSDTMDLFLQAEDGLINHFYIPNADKEKDECRVCQRAAHQHKQGDFESVRKEFNQEQEESLHLKQYNKEFEKLPKRVCEICYIEVIESDMVKIRDQLHNICLQCMENYLKEEIGSMRVEHLSCPHCQQSLPNELIRSLVDLPNYNKYRQFLRNLEIQKNPHLKWCPNPKCSVVVNTNPQKKTSKCPKCATQICNRCNREAHPKTSCEGAFQKQIKNWQNASDIQKCKKCHGLVEKIAGCNHMTCSLCHYQWCWLCGSQYTTAHFSALNPFGCPGLQDRQRDDWGKCKIILLRVGILFLILMAIPIMLPVAMVAVGPVLATQLLFDCFYPESCCKKLAIVILASVLGFIANPIVWVGCIFYFIPKGIIRLRDWYRERQGVQERRNSYLQERLLGEEIFQQK